MSGVGEGEVVSKEVGEERGAQGGVDRRSDNATSVDVEIDPHCRRLGRSQTDFAQALQAILDFGVFAFLPFSLGPAGDCPCRH